MGVSKWLGFVGNRAAPYSLTINNTTFHEIFQDTDFLQVWYVSQNYTLEAYCGVL